VAFECVKFTTVETGPQQLIVIGRVLAVHIDDAMIKSAERGHVDTPALDLVARTFGSGYTRTRDTFDMARPNWANYLNERKGDMP
jgi:flavin reductase (DIM6/NTAB) family NADH-FMN oxidoreductase RutF